MNRAGALGLAGLSAVALVSGGIAVGAFFLDAPDSPSVSSQQGADTVAVTVASYDGARDRAFAVVLGVAAPLEASDAGRVTRSTCVPGAQIASGDSPFTIDDRPIFALATSIPLWKDLARGATGEDVRALQTELAALGYTVSADGKFGTGTERAVKAFLTDRGVVRPSGVLAAASVMWLPQPTVTVGTCDVAVGAQFSGGSLATTAGGLQGLVEVKDPTDDASAGTPRPHVVKYGALEATIDEDGLITDPAFLTAIAAGGEFAFSQTSEGGGKVTLRSVLAEPLDVAALPPGAIYDVVGTIGCVVGDGVPTPVTVIASALGQTSVTFDSAVPSQVAVAPDAGAGGCR